MRRLIFLLAMLFVISTHDAVAEIAGRASVIDGDTIEIGGERIRFLRHRHAGEFAALRPGWSAVSLRPAGRTRAARQDRRENGAEKDVDRYGRSVAVCFVGGEDINRWMTFQVWALAYRKYSRDYVDAEDEARATGRGLWRGAFEPPWDWRKEHPRGGATRR